MKLLNQLSMAYKKMNQNDKALFVVIVVCISSLVGYFIVAIIHTILISHGTSEYPFLYIVRYILIALSVFAGFLYLILFYLFCCRKTQAEKAKKFKLQQSTFSELEGFIAEKMEQNGYVCYGQSRHNSHATLTLYMRGGHDQAECLALLRQSELTSNISPWADEELLCMLQKYFCQKTLRAEIRMTTIVCVDRLTPTFQNFVNNGAAQTIKSYRLPIGISFGGRKIYVAQFTGFLGNREYKQMLDNFMEMMEYPEELSISDAISQ